MFRVLSTSFKGLKLTKHQYYRNQVQLRIR
nr:MAG TPA: hypothetical protein [Bacteriophage sp.]